MTRMAISDRFATISLRMGRTTGAFFCFLAMDVLGKLGKTDAGR
jgi:hypothetical protein